MVFCYCACVYFASRTKHNLTYNMAACTCRP